MSKKKIEQDVEEGRAVLSLQYELYDGTRCIDLRTDQVPENFNIKEIGNIKAFGMTINCIIGTGFFVIPYSFYHAGLPLSIVLIIMCGLMSGIGAVWSLEVQARARNYQLCAKDKDYLEAANNRITFQKIEFSRFAFIFSGLKGEIFVSVVLLLYTQGSLWSYASVFSSTTANLFSKYILRREQDCIIEEVDSTSECKLIFFLSAAVYAGYVFTIVLFDVDKLGVLQMFFTIYRFLSFTLMVASSIVSLAFRGVRWPSGSSDGWYTIKMAGFPMLFASASVSLNGHFNLPNAVAAPLRGPKTHAHTLAFTATLTAATLYIICSIIVDLALGPDVHEFVVLNWSKFGDRGFVHDESEVVQTWWSIALRLVIMLFPMMNMMSSYPLVVGTVGGSLHGFFPEKAKEKLGRAGIVLCRFIAATTPFVLCLLLPNLQFTADFAGLFAIILEVFIPAYYLLYSKHVMGAAASKTPYTGWWSRLGLVIIVLIVAVGFFVYSIVQFIIDYT